MSYTLLTFAITEQEQKDILSALLNTIDNQGIEETENTLLVYFETASFDQAAVDEVVSSFFSNYIVSEIPQQNWNTEWEKNFQPVIIQDFCSVRAHFHPKPEQVTYDIVITPKMSFGTGHHATTALMMGFMKDINFKGKSVFDFGTGTGILAILANMLGASAVLAIDNDEWSYQNAIENCERNNAANVKVVLSQTEQLPVTETFDIILANINRHILLVYMQSMASYLKDNGILLLSGILPEDIDIITQSSNAAGLQIIETRIERNWVCMQIVKPG